LVETNSRTRRDAERDGGGGSLRIRQRVARYEAKYKNQTEAAFVQRIAGPTQKRGGKDIG